jgi:hypothetical protein
MKRRPGGGPYMKAMRLQVDGKIAHRGEKITLIHLGESIRLERKWWRYNINNKIN